MAQKILTMPIIIIIVALITLALLIRARLHLARSLYEASQQSVKQGTVSLLRLKKDSPRSVGMIVGMIALMVTANPYAALGFCIGVWFLTFLILSKLPPSLINTIWWSRCSRLLNAIAEIYPVRWIVLVSAVFVSFFQGAPPLPTVQIMGGLLVYDMIIVIMDDIIKIIGDFRRKHEKDKKS